MNLFRSFFLIFLFLTHCEINAAKEVIITNHTIFDVVLCGSINLKPGFAYLLSVKDICNCIFLDFIVCCESEHEGYSNFISVSDIKVTLATTDNTVVVINYKEGNILVEVGGNEVGVSDVSMWRHG
jgi:hypothetical protein